SGRLSRTIRAMTHRALPRRAAMTSVAIPVIPRTRSRVAPLRADDVVTFVDAGEQDVAEVERPDAVINFLEADDLLLERVRDEEQAFLESDRPGIRDPLGNVMAWVLDRG